MKNFEKIAKILKENRQSKNLDIATVSKKLKIRKQYLYSLENASIDEIPGDAYISGYLKMYSEFLGISEEINNIKNQGERPQIRKQNNYNKLYNKWFFNRKILIYFVLLGILVFLIILLFFGESDKTKVKQIMEYLITDEFGLNK